MIAELKRARHLLEVCGWVGPKLEPFSRDCEGRICSGESDGVARLSVMDALIEARAWPEGWYLLEEVVAPANAALDRFDVKLSTLDALRRFQKLCRSAVDEPTLMMWLLEWDRKDEEVLAAFVEAIKRSKKAGERHG